MATGVPDQRCTVSLRSTLHRIRDTMPAFAEAATQGQFLAFAMRAGALSFDARRLESVETLGRN
jgi:hypothetical protein